MALDFQTRRAIDMALGDSLAIKDCLFIGYPSLIRDTSFRDDYLESRFPNGWECVDISDNQDTTFVADFCTANLGRVYDVIIDHGSLQHFYDPFAGIRNVLRHLKPGGIAIHVLPFTGYGGFGYWQISPLIFSEIQRQDVIKIKELLFFTQGNWRYYFRPSGNLRGEFHFARRARFSIAYKKTGIQLPTTPFYQRDVFDQPSRKVYEYRGGQLRFTLNQLISVMWEEILLRPAYWRADNGDLECMKF